MVRACMQVAQPLVTTLLCVSKKEVFLQAWMPFMESCLRQFKVCGATTMGRSFF